MRGALGIWNILALVVTQMFTYSNSMFIILLLFIIYAIFRCVLYLMAKSTLRRKGRKLMTEKEKTQ